MLKVERLRLVSRAYFGGIQCCKAWPLPHHKVSLPPLSPSCVALSQTGVVARCRSGLPRFGSLIVEAPISVAPQPDRHPTCPHFGGIQFCSAWPPIGGFFITTNPCALR
jgi:hypothetical protein